MGWEIEKRENIAFPPFSQSLMKSNHNVNPWFNKYIYVIQYYKLEHSKDKPISVGVIWCLQVVLLSKLEILQVIQERKSVDQPRSPDVDFMRLSR